MTPQDWNVLMGSDATVPKVKATVAKEARAHLNGMIPDDQISTNDLVEALYPRYIADRTVSGDSTRRLIYKYLAALARAGMEDCCVKGEVNGKYMGRDKRPWLWFKPPEQETCCMCGQVLPEM